MTLVTKDSKCDHAMSDAVVEPTAYDILGVAPDVPESELRRAYRAQALKVHPDHVSSVTTSRRRPHPDRTPCSVLMIL